MAPDLVSLRGVSLRKPGSLVLRHVDLDVEAGDAVALFGANGSGKTTLLRVIATLARPSGGEGDVLGARLGTAAVDEIRHKIGLVGHEPALYPNLTLGENIAMAATLLAGSQGAAMAQEALERVGLGAAADRKAARSSNGMKRRIEFARMMVKRPMLLLLDEAHVGLDAAAWGLVGHLIEDVTSRRGAVIVVAHERERVRPLVSRAVELVDGKLIGATT